MTNDFKFDNALDRIAKNYGDDVSIELKAKALVKFGERSDLGTDRATIGLIGGELHETLLNTNDITTVVSTSTSDTGTIYYEGHTIDDDGLTFVSGTATLTGRTPALLSTPVARINRAYTTSESHPTFAGTVSFYEGGAQTNGVVSDATEVHLQLQIGEAQSQKCQTSISKNDYWLLTSISASYIDKGAGFVDFRLEIKPYDSNIWRPITQTFGISDGKPTENINFDSIKIVPKNHDVRVTAVADNASTRVSAGIVGELAIVK